MPLAQPRRHRGQQDGDGHREPRHPQRSGRGPLPRPQILFRLVPAGLDRVGMFQQALRGGGEPHPAPLRLQQVDAQVPGELPDLLGGGRGGEMQGAGGRGDGAVVGDGPEHVQPAQINHEVHASRWSP